MDKYLFEKPVKIEGEIDRDLEKRLWRELSGTGEWGYKWKYFRVC